MPSPSRRLTTLWFTDIAGFSFKGATTAIAGGPFQLRIGIHGGDMGRRKGAADALDRLARASDPDLIWLGVDPEWTSTRDEAQFRRLASRALGSH